jgi:hypothetical protein
MTDHQELLDAFAEARRSWDDLVGLQPDVIAGSGTLDVRNLAEIDDRVTVHREAMDALAEVLRTHESQRGRDTCGRHQ